MRDDNERKAYQLRNGEATLYARKYTLYITSLGDYGL
jgi:hypothetical protein